MWSRLTQNQKEFVPIGILVLALLLYLSLTAALLEQSTCSLCLNAFMITHSSLGLAT